MRSRATLLLFVLAFACSCLSQSAPPAKLPDVSADAHYKLIFHNEYTNVYMLKLKPGEETHVNIPHGFFRIALTNANIALKPDNSVPVNSMNKGEGELFAAGGDSFVKNESKNPYSAIVVESVKNKINAKLADSTPFLGYLAPSDASVDADPFDLGLVTIHPVAVPPQEATKWHTHKYPHLMIAISELEMKVETKGKPTQKLEMEPGTVKWLAAVPVEHRLVNTAKETPEDPKKKLEREMEGEEKEADEAEMMFVSIEFK